MIRSTSEPAAGAVPGWSPALRVSFRFLFSYVALTFGLEPLALLPRGESIAMWYHGMWQPIVTWAGAHVFHLGRELPLVSDGGSGDDTAHFVLLFCEVALAAGAALAWTALDRRARDHRRLHAAARVFVRYLLGGTLLWYGMLKLVKGQFLFPPSARLEEPYGEASPMGLLWTFMGYSTLYNLFTGAAEAGAAVLLLFRRTARLGALLAAAVMANVLMINLSYDVPVKIFAASLLLMAVFLLAPDLRLLVDLLVLRRPTTPPPAAPRRDGPWWRRHGRLVLEASIASYLVVSIGWVCLDRWQRFDRLRARVDAANATSWAVDDVVRNGRPVPLAQRDGGRWVRLDLGPRGARVVTMDDRAFAVAYDATRQVLAVPGGRRGEILGTLTCRRPDADHLVLAGRLAADEMIVTLHTLDPRRSYLVSRRFHWIDEAPDDR